MESFQDLGFGVMRWEGTEWVLEARVLFNGVEVPVRIEPEDPATNEVSELQCAAARLVLALPDDILQTSAPAVVQNYEVYREMIDDDELPPLSAPSDVWQAVSPSCVTVPPHGAVTTPTFLLFAECDWDLEHGLVVRFRNGLADESNQQGELGL